MYFIKDLLHAVIVFGANSLMMALIWLQMNSPDLAITEAAAGIRDDGLGDGGYLPHQSEGGVTVRVFKSLLLLLLVLLVAYAVIMTVAEPPPYGSRKIRSTIK